MNDFCEGCNQRFAPIDQQACWFCKDGDLNSSKREITSNNAQIFATGSKDGRKLPENVPETNVGKINGRTPDEIKKWLEYCHSSKPCIDCKYDQRDFPHCVRRLLADAINGYEQLETRLAQAERERDAAVADLKSVDEKYEDLKSLIDNVTFNHEPYSLYLDFREAADAMVKHEHDDVWNGYCPENTKEEQT